MMNKNFYKEIINTLKKADIKLRVNNLSPMFVSDLPKSEIENYARRFCVPIIDQPTGKILPQVSILLMFFLFDTFLEDKYSLNPGQNFSERYRNLPDGSDVQIIEKECYRLMKLIRNACVHNNVSISDNDPISFNYLLNNYRYNLDIHKDKMNLMFSAIVFIVIDNYKLKTDGHFNGIIRSYYDELKDYVDQSGNFRDKNSNLLKPISNGTRIKPYHRTVVIHPEYKIHDNTLIIIDYMKEDYPEYGIDYLIDFNSAEYIIPNECLSENRSIIINDLGEWKVFE